jgi:hypothetical protein
MVYRRLFATRRDIGLIFLSYVYVPGAGTGRGSGSDGRKRNEMEMLNLRIQKITLDLMRVDAIL